MVKFRHLLAAIIICSTLATVCALAQSSLTQIRDLITNSDGTPFNGMVVITWNGFSVPSGTPVSQLSASARIYNGALSVLLVPTTTATAGTYYQVVYSSSDGTVTWTETWQVPPSTTPLNLSQVRQSTTQGSGGGGGAPTTGGGQYATLPIAISQVTNLSSSLSTLNTAVASLNTQVATLATGSNISALQTTVNSLSSTVSGLTTTVNGLNSTVTGLTGTVTANNASITSLNSSVGAVTGTVSGLTTTVNGLSSTVTGLSGTVATNNSSITSLNSSVGTVTTTVSGLSASITSLTNTVNGLVSTVNNLSSMGSSAVYVDAQVPTGTINGSNNVFNLPSAPSPASSLSLYRNGLLQAPSVDYTLAGMVITFLSGSTPITGDTLQAYYRLPGTGTSSTMVDSEIPAGAVNGTNLTFTLASAPNPAASLKLYRNGLLLSQSGDYTLSGSTITFGSAATAPQSGDALLASYRH